MFTELCSEYFTDNLPQYQAHKSWRFNLISISISLNFIYILLKSNCSLTVTEVKLIDKILYPPPITCTYFTMWLQWEGSITALHTCLLQHTSLQHITLLWWGLFVVSTFIMSDQQLQTWDLYLCQWCCAWKLWEVPVNIKCQLPHNVALTLMPKPIQAVRPPPSS